jgi:hypothetical protein
MRKSTNVIKVIIGTILIAMLFTFSSCDNATDSDPQQEGSIIGTWLMVNIKLYATPVGDLSMEATQFLEMSGTGASISVLQFDEGGTASVTTTYTDTSQDTVGGSWTLNGDSLTVVGAGIDGTVGYEVNGDSMTLTRIMQINFVPDTPTEPIKTEMRYDRIN